MTGVNHILQNCLLSNNLQLVKDLIEMRLGTQARELGALVGSGREEQELMYLGFRSEHPN